MAKIYIKYNAAVLKEVDLTKDVTTFGRKTGNDIIIENPAISSFHGKIVKDGDAFFIEDLNSTNGTYLNGQRIKRSALKNHDQISVARHIIEFITEASAPTTGQILSAMPSLTEPPVQANISESSSIKPQRVENPPPPSASTPEPVTSEPPEPPQKYESEVKNVKLGILRLISGHEVPQEIVLKDLVTYVGSAEQALVKLKGFMVPSLAAAISKRPEGYFLKAIKSGYPKVNGAPIKDQIFLEPGALIEFGAIAMVFQYKDSGVGS